MNFKFLPGLLSLPLLLSGCIDKEDVTNYDYNTTIKSINVVTSLIDGSTEASKGEYSFYLDGRETSNMGSINGMGISINHNSCSLSIPSTAFATNGFTTLFKNVSGTLTGSANYFVGNGTFYLSTLFNVPVDTPYKYSPEIIVAQYIVGNEYRVNTFPEVVCFVGTINVNYKHNRIPQNYSATEVIFQFAVNMNDNTAEFIFNNARFTDLPQEMPKNMLKISGLNLDFDNGAIFASGSDIVPEEFVSNKFVACEDMIFNSIDFQTTSTDLTKGYMTFKMTDKDDVEYTGTFGGSYTMISINN